MPRRKVRSSVKKNVVPKLPVARPLRFRFRRDKTPVEKVADVMTGFFGSIAFLFVNLGVFLAWVAWNIELHPAFSPFDPYPFGMLTMMVSLEAIVLTVVVLISQNRANKVADAREEIDVEIDVASEKQIAAIMQSLDLILHHLQINHIDDLEAMKEINLERLERRVIHDIDTD